MGRSLATVELYPHSENAEQGRAKASPNEMDSLIGVLDVHQAIAELPERQADCMRLHVLFDQDIDEVALYLGISASAVTSNLYYARRKLAARLGDSDGEEVAAG
jgi:DNA-directed RNA polymerase specialized sigma24 family protein